MTHRKEITGLSYDLPLQAVLEIVISKKYTRFPLYNGNIDNIIGILHTKDLLPLLNLILSEMSAISDEAKKALTRTNKTKKAS